MDRQKKILIFGGAWVSAMLLTWFLYARTVAPQQERHVRVVVATHDLPLGTLLRASDVRLVNYPQHDIPKGVILQTKDATNKVALVSLYANEPVLISKLSAPTSLEGFSSIIEPGYRAVSVPITDASGVAGLIQPNSKVDVLFTRTGSLAEAATSTILQDVKVISTGKLLAAGQVADPRAPKSQVVTLVLTPEDAQKLELAKSQGRISLSLRNPLDNSETQNSGPVTTEALDPGLSERLALAKRASRINPGAFDDLKKEPPKKKEPEKPPRVVVDVYRGDKHVQELFR
ncbi:MAG: Flp pilus assembly protein CpaB [Bryobacteraceae bacterium]